MGHHHRAIEEGDKKDSMDSRLLFSVIFNGIIVIAEIIGGFLSGSLALLSLYII